MLEWQNTVIWIHLQRNPIEGVVRLAGKERDVDAPAGEPLLNLVDAVLLENVDLDLRVFLLKLRDDARQPRAADRRERTDADTARLNAAEHVIVLVEAVVRRDELTDQRQHLAALTRELDALVAALEQRKANLALHTLHHVGDGGLCIAQILAGLGKASLVKCTEQDFILLDIQRHPFLSARSDIFTAVTCDECLNHHNILRWISPQTSAPKNCAKCCYAVNMQARIRHRQAHIAPPERKNTAPPKSQKTSAGRPGFFCKSYKEYAVN